MASPVDRRSHALKLTTAGQNLLKRAKALAALHEARLLERFGPGQHRALLEMLRDFDTTR
jgi:DNA-binding MarR family transcriptional regulator